MREAWVIAKREFLERVRSKWFIVMTVLWPVLMVGMIVFPALIGRDSFEGARVAIVDKSGQLGDDLAKALASPEPVGLKWNTSVVPTTTTDAELRHEISTKQLNGFLVVPADALDGGEIVYSGDNASNQTVQILLKQSIPAVVLKKRARVQGVTDAQLAAVFREVHVSTEHTTGEAKGKSGMVAFVLGYILSFLLYIAITLYGVNVMRSVVTEKSSRVVELLVATTKPRSLMAGKIGGVGAAGLAQIAIWMTIGGLALAYQDALLSAFGAKPTGHMLPSLSADQIVVVIAFFMLGFLFYAAMYAAVGAMVSSEQDSQQAQMPITLFLVVGFVCLQVVTNDPRGGTTAILTNVPFWSPMLMPLRYFLGGATLGQVGLSLGVLAIATYVVSLGAAKIYRVGILMYGKRPGLGELFRWLRY